MAVGCPALIDGMGSPTLDQGRKDLTVCPVGRAHTSSTLQQLPEISSLEGGYKNGEIRLLRETALREGLWV